MQIENNEKLIVSLKSISSYSVIMFLKLSGFHFTLVSPTFFTLHSKLKDLYNIFLNLYDATNERLMQLSSIPVASLKSVRSYATDIAEFEEVNSVTADYIIDVISNDFKIIIDEIRNAIKISNQNNDYVTADILTKYLTDIEAQFWMVKSSTNL